MTGVIEGITTEVGESGGRNLSESVTRYRMRQGMEELLWAVRSAAAFASGLFASQTGSTTVFQKLSEFAWLGWRKKLYIRKLLVLPGRS
jgi:hypothetical protein